MTTPADGSFVYDDPATLDYPKTDYEVFPLIPTSQKIPADHWNRLSRAVDDLRFAVRALITGGSSSLVVTHTSTGSDGTDFTTVAIGATMASAVYGVFWCPAGGTAGDGKQISRVPFVDVPTADRTTTTFRFTTDAQMAAGDKVQFVIVGATV